MRPPSDARELPKPTLKERIATLRPLWIGLFATVALLWVAALNGYPTMFSDSGGYLLTGLFLVPLHPFRAPGYGVFMRFASRGESAWLIVVAQALIVAYVLYEVCDFFAEGERDFRDRLLLTAVCSLAVLTSLPWVVALLMPDVFAGVLLLCEFLLAFREDLRPIRRIGLALVLVISVAAHTSFLPTAILLALAVILWKVVEKGAGDVRAARTAAVWLLVPILASGIVTASLNRKMGLGFRYSASGDRFLLARLFSDGLAADFLQKNCPDKPFISCQYLGDLPRTQEEFLFQHPLVTDLTGHEDEMTAIVRGAIRAHPLRFAVSSAKDTMLQLAALRTGDEIRSYGAREWNAGVLEQIFPDEFASYSQSRQVRGLLLPVADAAAKLHVPAFWLSVALCLVAAQSSRFPRVNAFFYSTILFLILNAAVCATVAGVFDRYQSRAAWLVPFCLIAYAYCWVKAPQTRAADSVRLTVSPSPDSSEATVDAEVSS